MLLAEETLEAVRRAPEPLRGGLLRFLREHHMLSRGYLRLYARLAWYKLRLRGRLKTDGIAFLCKGVHLEIAPGAQLQLGRWSWLGDDCKVRVHEGVVEIGAKSVLGQECTISCYEHI